MAYTKDDLKTMQAWDLQRKIQVTQTRIIEWYEHFNGQIYISFSGGKDSTVLLDLARRIYPNIEAVFVDTGLEYPEIRDFVKTKENVTWLKPTMRFDEIIKNEGYPIISKEISKIICGARNSVHKKQNYINRLDGLNSDFSFSKYKQQYKKWKHLLTAPFKISNRCCWYMKEKPFQQFESKTKLKPIIGTMASESLQRKQGWLKTGCNAFKGRKISKPMGFWTEQDVLTYLKQFNISYCNIYGDIVEENLQTSLFPSRLHCTGLERTGCMFCMYGVHLEQRPNRFECMKLTHPKQYFYCMNTLGLDDVLDYINVRH